MGDEERKKRRQELLNDVRAIVKEEIGDTRSIVREELDKAFKESVIPGDYERCPGCGELKKINKPCPWCEEARNTKTGDDDEFGLEGI